MWLTGVGFTVRSYILYDNIDIHLVMNGATDGFVKSFYQIYVHEVCPSPNCLINMKIVEIRDCVFWVENLKLM